METAKETGQIILRVESSKQTETFPQNGPTNFKIRSDGLSPLSGRWLAQLQSLEFDADLINLEEITDVKKQELNNLYKAKFSENTYIQITGVNVWAFYTEINKGIYKYSLSQREMIEGQNYISNNFRTEGPGVAFEKALDKMHLPHGIEGNERMSSDFNELHMVKVQFSCESFFQNTNETLTWNGHDLGVGRLTKASDIKGRLSYLFRTELGLLITDNNEIHFTKMHGGQLLYMDKYTIYIEVYSKDAYLQNSVFSLSVAQMRPFKNPDSEKKYNAAYSSWIGRGVRQSYKKAALPLRIRDQDEGDIGEYFYFRARRKGSFMNWDNIGGFTIWGRQHSIQFDGDSTRDFISSIDKFFDIINSRMEVHGVSLSENREDRDPDRGTTLIMFSMNSETFDKCTFVSTAEDSVVSRAFGFFL